MLMLSSSSIQLTRYVQEKKAIAECKKTAKMGTRGGEAVKILAKNVIMIRNNKNRLELQKVTMNSGEEIYDRRCDP